MLDAYCWPQSARAGSSVDLMISGDASSCVVEIVRIGATEQLVERFDEVRLTEQPIPADIGRNGCEWTPSLRVAVSREWTSGFYLVRLRASTGDTIERADAFFVVKAATPGDTLLVLSTSTYASYNDWGAPSFYTGGHESSLLRPLPRGFLEKDNPERYRAAAFIDLPREESRAHFASNSYWSVAAGFGNWERLFVAWAENHGIQLDYATSLDLASDPTLLDPYRCYVSVGHDEYWTASMRDHVESWVDDGGAALFFSGNTSFWQIRLEADNTRSIGYKFDLEQDPLFGTTAESAVSTMWSDPVCNRPENQMTGVSFTRGGYANMPHSPRGGGYTVHVPEHWVFAGLDLDQGDIVGDDPMVVGYECDGCEIRWEDGRPIPTGAGGTSTNFEILGTAPAKLWETHEIAGGLSQNYVGELNWVAERLGGGDAKATRDRFAEGHALMGTFERGNGWVFTTGCTDWAYGLGDPQVSQITLNLVARALGIKE